MHGLVVIYSSDMNNIFVAIKVNESGMGAFSVTLKTHKQIGINPSRPFSQPLS